MNRRSFYKNLMGLGILSTIDPKLLLSGSTDSVRCRTHKAQRLRPGDRVALITPGSPITEEKLQKSIQNIKHLGLIPSYTQRVKLKYGYLAGKDAERLQDLHDHFRDPSIKAIWCIRGGYGTGRLLPFLDYKLIRKNPKILIGYSDITALLQAIHIKSGLMGFHGPMSSSDFDAYNVGGLRRMLIRPEEELVIPFPESDPSIYRVISSGTASGKLIGGNLSLAAALCGTPYRMDFRDKIVFLEDIGEKPYRIDRMLTQLLQSGLQDAAAIALGIFADCAAKPDDRSLSLEQVIEDRLGSLNIPVVYGLPFGHIQNQWTIPIGCKARLDTGRAELRLLQKAVE